MFWDGNLYNDKIKNNTMWSDLIREEDAGIEVLVAAGALRR